jgi:hypothetical protein
MTTAWTIAIDWDRNGDFTTSGDDVTGYVIDANWFLGFRRLYEDTADNSKLQLTLDNSDKRFSPENTSSPPWDSVNGFSKVAPFRPVKVTSDDGTTVRTHWIGWIETVEPSVNVNGERIVKITAAGPMQFFKAAETDIELQENQRTDQIIARLIEEVVIPPALTEGCFLDLPGYSEIGVSAYITGTETYSDLDEGHVTLAIAADNWTRRSDETHDTFNVYRAIADVVAAERGRFYFARDGKAIFWNRIYVQDDIPSSLTLDDSMTDLEYVYAGIGDDFKNEVIVVCHPRTLGDSDTDLLWELDSAIRVEAGKECSDWDKPWKRPTAPNSSRSM